MSHRTSSRPGPVRRRRLATAATVVLLAGGVAACGSDSASEETDAAPAAGPRPVELAADWLLANRNADGLLENTTSYEGKTSTMTDVGSSIDLALGLSALDLEPAEAEAITDAVEASLADYVGSGGERYAGPTAKALRLVVDQDRDPRAFGGVDLQARVEQAVVRRGAAAGRLRDRSEYGDYANSIGQGYAAAALTELDSPRADQVTDFLLLQQCDEGFFRLAFSEPDARDQSCGAGDAAAADEAPDTTALVAVQLASVAEAAEESGSPDPDVQEALDDVAAWLLAQQAADGSFADPQNGTNANTTGLAGWALHLLGEDEAAARAAAWLRGLQVGQEQTEDGELAEETGAIAYDESSLAQARRHGLSDPLDRSPWVGAGVQAFPALAAADEDGNG
ncbi:hypothetical protein [Nocardioides campestrisoli]|uniref:hypothetical protein n=1 Tax=Nocardioides campestrisoli TaxID=2736757 RepID=UPI0015E6F2D2|nr:hypothetical protein [Nocardioides campestrisoli]